MGQKIRVVKARTLYDNVIRYYSSDQEFPLKKGIFCVGSTCFGDDIVEIECPKTIEFSLEKWNELNFGNDCDKDKKKSHFAFEPKILRVAKNSELEQYQANINKAEGFRATFEEKIQQYNINMKIERLYYTLMKDRLICTYTSGQRVDFRELVKDLGSLLKQRIELYQISMHDIFSVTNDCGVCGRQLCCTLGCTFDLQQNKKNASSKMLGVCGRVKCCISYEKEE